MAKTEKHCWWMRRKETDLSPLSEVLKEQHRPPFLSFCGLTVPKHFCCSMCSGGLCCLQNTQCHHEQQPGKMSSTGWQDPPPEDLNVLKSLGNRAGAGWGHRCPQEQAGKQHVGQSHGGPLPHQPLCSWG